LDDDDEWEEKLEAIGEPYGVRLSPPYYYWPK